jgi:hypothetical protein
MFKNLGMGVVAALLTMIVVASVKAKKLAI